MNYRNLFPKEYLAAEDLGDKDVTLTISRLKQDILRTEHGTEKKWCIYFEEMEARLEKDKSAINKRLVTNVTNARSIAKQHGPETDDWSGKKITLYRTQCMAFGEMVDCIRVREPEEKNR